MARCWRSTPTVASGGSPETPAWRSAARRRTWSAAPLAAVFDGLGEHGPAWPPDDAPARPRHLSSRSGERGRWDVAAHQAGRYTLVEFEPAPADEPGAGSVLAQVQRAAIAIEAADDVRALCQACARAIHAMSGFDRVCVQRFMGEGGLEVMASVAPASWPHGGDAPGLALPDAARMHAIPDLDYSPAPVLPARLQDGGLDLRHAILQGLAPAPRRRLRRLGAAAVLSMPILVRGRNWGMVTCLHAVPRPAPAAMRAACELLLRLGALRIESLDRLHEHAALVVQEAHHRVQNSLHIVASMLRLQARQTGDAQTRLQLEAAIGRLTAVGAAHRQLSRPDDARGVPLERYLGELCRDLATSWGEAWTGQLTVDACGTTLSADATVNLGLVVAELLTNAAKYAYRGAPGPINVHARKDGDWLQVSVADQGQGMHQDDAGNGLGSRLTRAFAAQLGGRIELSSDSQGTTAAIRVPLIAVECGNDPAG